MRVRPGPPAACAAVLLGACGGSSDEDTIRGIVEEGSSTDPAWIFGNLTEQGPQDVGGREQREHAGLS